MSAPYLLASVARISDLDRGDFDVGPLARDGWATGDYVAARVTGRPSSLYRFELTSGRMMEAMEGTRVIGALGKRAATLEATGDWEAIGDDGRMQALTGAGLFGRATSVAPWLPRMMSLEYEGHVLRHGQKQTMAAFVRPLEAPSEFVVPAILLIGTSMSSGKTTTGRVIVHELKGMGLRVAAAKLTGAGRYRDILSFHDAGADTIVDFVDAGLPSTIVSRPVFDQAMQYMLARVAESGADVLVAEAGASPLEPYNGEAAVAALRPTLCCTVLCASDPYAVLGVKEAFRITPDFVTGPAANTEAGIQLVSKLTGLTAVNLITPEAIPRLVGRLRERVPPGLLSRTK